MSVAYWCEEMCFIEKCGIFVCVCYLITGRYYLKVKNKQIVHEFYTPLVQNIFLQ